jgi:O-antigen ligase
MDRERFHHRASWIIIAGIFILVFFSIRLTNFLIILYVINWVAGSSKATWRWQTRDWLLLLIISPWLLEIASVLYSSNVMDGLHQVEKRLVLIAIPVITLHSYKSAAKESATLFRIGTVCTFLVTLCCLSFALYNFFFHSVKAFYWFDFTRPIISDPGYVALMINVVCIGIMGELITVWNSPSSVSKFLCLGLIAYFGVITFLLASKLHAVVFLMIVITGLVVIYRRYVVGWKNSAVIIALLAAIGFSLSKSEIIERYSHIDNFTVPPFDAPDEEFNELTLRLAILECSVDIIKENPVFGTGVGDVMPDLILLYRKLDFKFGFNNAYDPHNQYVRACLATGIVGLACFLASLVATLVVSIRSKNWQLFAFMIVLCVAFLFESVLERHTGIVIYAFFHSILVFGAGDGKGSEAGALSRENV